MARCPGFPIEEAFRFCVATCPEETCPECRQVELSAHDVAGSTLILGPDGRVVRWDDETVPTATAVGRALGALDGLDEDHARAEMEEHRWQQHHGWGEL